MCIILHVTDLHYHKPFYDWVKNQLDNYDVLCITGDFIGNDELEISQENINDQIKWVSAWLETMTKPVYICSGNHDVDNDTELLMKEIENMGSDIDNQDDFYEDGFCEYHQSSDLWLDQIDNVWVHSDGSIFTSHGITFGCSPYYAAELSMFHQCDVLLHHEPPLKTKTSHPTEGGDWGNKNLKDALDEGVISPKYVLCGHVHNPISKKVRIKKSQILNPGSTLRTPIPNHNFLEIKE